MVEESGAEAKTEMAKVRKETEDTMKERLKDVVTSLTELTEDVEAVKARAAAAPAAEPAAAAVEGA